MGCHALLQGISPTKGLKPHLFTSPTLAGRFFTTRATWENLHILYNFLGGFFGDSAVKNQHANAGDPCLISGLERSPGVGSGNPLWYSRLEDPMNKEA